MFLEFQVTRLVPFAGYFAFGVYAQSRGWFADGRPLGSLALWGAISAVLAVAYLVVGQPVFADTAGRQICRFGFLLVFAFIRSFLAAVAAGRARLVRQPLLETLEQVGPGTFGHVLRYLSHALLVRGRNPNGTVELGGRSRTGQDRNRFPSTLTLSFAFSRWVLARHSRAFAIAILALFVFCLAVRP